MAQFKEITKKARTTAKDMMKHMYSEEYDTIEPFRGVLKNSFNRHEIPKTLALSMNIPIIEEEVNNPIYTKDIDDDINLDENIKDICRDIRRKNMKEKLIWWMRSGLSAIGMKESTLRDITDGSKKLSDFGYTKEILKDQEIKQILSVRLTDANETTEKQLIDCGISTINVYKRIQPPNSITRQKMDAVYIPNQAVMDIFDDHTSLKLCKYLLKVNTALLIYVNCTNSALLQIAYSISSQQRQIKCNDLSAKLDNIIKQNEEARKEHQEAMKEARENTDRICGKLDNVENQLKDKKEVVRNTFDKGVLIVQFLDESGYNVPDDKYLIYLHGGKRSYWNTYETKADKYYVLYKFETISDHDKAIRKIKSDMNLEPINPKRHLFVVSQEQIDTIGEWLEEWQDKNK